MSLASAADPPIATATVTSFIIRWLYCFLASTALVNQSVPGSESTAKIAATSTQTGGINFALLGVAIYLSVRHLPEIISEQGYIQELVFYRGFIDLPSSLVIAFFTPWALAMFVQQFQTVLSLACVFAVIFGAPLTLASPFKLFIEVVREASLFETNFRLSLKQLYDGDRLTTQYPVASSNCLQTSISASKHPSQTAAWEETRTTRASSRGWEVYPTTAFLAKSKMCLDDFRGETSDDSSTDLGSADCENGRAGSDSDGNLSELSELLVATEQA